MFVTRHDCRLPNDAVAATQNKPDQYTYFVPQRRFRPLGPFASVSSAVMTHLPPSNNKSRKEQATGMEFPDEYCVLTQKNCPVLMGFGVRNKKLMGMKNIKVYAVGLYVDPKAAKHLLTSKQAEITATQGNPEQAVFDDLSKSHDVEKSLRMVISFGGVNQKNFWSALEERLAPPMKKANGASPLQEFGAQFDGVKFRKGLQLNFTSSKDGSLITQIDSKQVGVIKSPLLTQTLFDVYLGKDPVSPAAKESIGRGLINLAIEDDKANKA